MLCQAGGPAAQLGSPLGTAGVWLLPSQAHTLVRVTPRTTQDLSCTKFPQAPRVSIPLLQDLVTRAIPTPRQTMVAPDPHRIG